MGGKILKTVTKVKVDSTLEYLLASLKSPASKKTYDADFHKFFLILKKSISYFVTNIRAKYLF
jgi:hypothetical protein